MQDRFQLTLNGQELRFADVNQIAKEASLADDLVLAELLRLAPYSGGSALRGILPFSIQGRAFGRALITGVAGGVNVSPFRAVVGSRTLPATSAVDSVTDIRSAVYVNASGTTTEKTVTIPNGDGNAAHHRCHVIYATLMVDASAGSTTRLVKDPTTAVVAPASVIPNLRTSVTLGIVSGSEVTSGVTVPTLPADPTGGYNIALAYVRTIGTYTSGTTVATTDILEIAPVLQTNNFASAAPANRVTQGTTTFTNVQTWLDGGARHRSSMPAGMTGTVTRLIPIAINTAVDTSGSIVVDDSVDWRNRMFKCVTQGQGGSGGGFTTLFPWDSATAIPFATNSSANTQVVTQLSASFTLPAPVANLSKDNSDTIVTGGGVSDFFQLFVDTNGRLAFDWQLTASGLYKFFIWLEASAPYTNK